MSKLAGPILNKFQSSALAEWLASEYGERDFLRLRQMPAEEIEMQLQTRLEVDLREVLPEVSGRQVRDVVFFDGLETLHGPRDSESARRNALRPLAELSEGLGSTILCVFTGRDHVHHAEEVFTKRPLERHLIGGLSEPDAREFMSSCEIHDPDLQAAILKVSRDLETPKTVQFAESRGDHVPEVGYHPFALGLCADIAFNSRFSEESLDPQTFALPPGDLAKLTDRFLKSLGSDGMYEVWLEKLALTPRFDKPAATAMYGAASSMEAEAAWRRLISYSFLKPTVVEGWHTLHFKMRELLNERTKQTPNWKTEHDAW